MVPLFKNVGERSATKNYCPFRLSVVSTVFVDQIEKSGVFSVSNMILGFLDQLQIF